MLGATWPTSSTALAWASIVSGSRTGREMECVDVIRAVLLNDGNDVLTQASENRSDRDGSHDADHDAQHRQETSELVRAHAIQSHSECLTQYASWQVEFQLQF